MKKLLLASTVLAGLAFVATPASAAVKLDLGGYFAGYGLWTDDDTDNVREMNLRHDSEAYISGETTLDNGLTVGFHTEQDLGGDGTLTDEVYAYFSGGWGRINLGNEDGAAYLLQVGAPGGDTNVDGMRTYFQGFGNAALDQLAIIVRNNGATTAGGGSDTVFSFNGHGSVMTAGGATPLDYDQADFRQEEKITYLTPKWQGFQAGFSYAPEDGQAPVGNNLAVMEGDNTLTTVADFGDAASGNALAGDADYEDIWDVAVRWDGEFSGVGVSAGVGYSDSDIEGTGNVIGAALAAGDRGATALSDGVQSWNGGLSLAWNGFTLGGAYKVDSTEYTGVVNDEVNGAAVVNGDIDRDTWVVGLGWDNGPYHLGASYLDIETDIDGASNQNAIDDATDFMYVGNSNEVHKATVGAGYTFGPGMTFRGSVAWGEYEDVSADGADANDAADRSNNDFQQVAIGTDIQF